MLIYERIPAADIKAIPESIRYFYPNGTVMIDYKSNGDNTGGWQLYEENGQASLVIPIDEPYCNQYDLWELYLTLDATSFTMEPEWKLALERFNLRYINQVVRQQAEILPMPVFLQEELNKTDWEKIDAGTANGRHLPTYFKGLISDDDVLANYCIKFIWRQIERQGSLYEATYITGIIVATCLPYYKGSPVVQNRLLNFLHEVMALPHIDTNKELYGQLQASYQAATTAEN